MENLTITTLDSDISELKQKYTNAIQEYIKIGMKHFLEDNKVITDISFSFLFYPTVSPIFGNIEDLENIEIDLEDLSKKENYELWIESSDSDLVLDTVNSRKYFQEANDLINNLEIDFPNIFADNNDELKI